MKSDFKKPLTEKFNEPGWRNIVIAFVGKFTGSFSSCLEIIKILDV